MSAMPDCVMKYLQEKALRENTHRLLLNLWRKDQARRRSDWETRE